MPATYCEVALPVPLRSLFTYAIPDRLISSVCAGSRVLVPFRNRAMTGVVVEVSTRRPDPERVKNVREIVESLDPIPSLPPKLGRSKIPNVATIPRQRKNLIIQR